jgi:hypothetical protein
LNRARAAWWRAVYAAIGNRFTLSCAGVVLDAIAALRGPAASAHLLGVIEQRFAHSGWPIYERGWINLHMSRVVSLLRRRGRTTPATRARDARVPPRIGFVGRFVGLLGFPKELFDACPVELVIADISHEGRAASYLKQPGRHYAAFDLDGGKASPADVAAFINQSQVDLLINIGQKEEAFDILDGVDTPCVANFCAGSDLMHHHNVDLQFHGQPEADYFVVDGRMFCGTTRSVMPSSPVRTITGYIDPRGLLSRPRRPWREREPLVVCHGSLYKFAAPRFRDVLMQILVRNPEARLAMMGRSDGAALAAMQDAAHAAGVADRFAYHGSFSAMRGDDGALSDPGWQRLVELLDQARLAPNPFPLGGGSARFEAYASGVPSVHLAVRFDEDAWGRWQPGTCEIPSLLAPLGTARSVEEYLALCDRVLTDEAFADALAAEQLALARNVGDAPRWWTEILEGYAHWTDGERRAR